MTKKKAFNPPELVEQASLSSMTLGQVSAVN
jgi:hypothetical protein